MATTAMDLYIRRERLVYGNCRRRSHTLFAEAAAVYDTPFWSARADLGDREAICGADSDDATGDALAHDADVRAAFERLRGARSVRLRPATQLRFEPAAAIEGREVVM